MQLRSDGVSWRELDGEAVVLDLKSSKYLKVNGPGTALFQRLKTPATREELIAVLTSAYDVSAETAATDTDNFLADLRERRLLDE